MLSGAHGLPPVNEPSGKLHRVIEIKLNDHGLRLPKPNFSFDGEQFKARGTSHL